MSDPVDPLRTTTAPEAHASASSDRDRTAAAVAPGNAPASGPRFGPPEANGEVGTLGPYRVVKELGKGGMGAVYLAIDTRLNRKLALKVMLPEFAADAAAKERFLREARAVAQITQDNVVTVYEADEREGVPYIAMQFLQGYPLDDFLKKKGSPALHHCVRIVIEAARGLAAAHALGLVHRDIKPANLWLEAPNGRVKVLDFGLAKPMGTDSELTKSGAVVGTPAYMSPEQARGMKVDHRTDLFSLGAVLYRLCTGKTPFERPSVMAVLLAVSTEQEPDVRTLNPQVPPTLARLIHQLLAKNPDHRPRTAEEVADRLQAIGERPWAEMADLPSAVTRPVLPSVAVPVVPQSPEQSINVFRNIDASINDPSYRPIAKPLPKPKTKPRFATGRGTWVAVGAVAVLAATVIVIAVLTLTKKTTGTKSDAADGSKDSPVAAAPRKDPPPVGPKEKDPLPGEADRRGAEYVLSIGGRVQVDFVDEDLRNRGQLPRGEFKLTRVLLRDNPSVTDTGLAACAGCGSVRHLDLVRTAVGDAGLAHFKESRELIVLDLDDASLIGDAGLAHFARVTTLTALWLGGTGVTDAGLATFAGCKSLRYIDVKRTRVTDAGLAHLRDCTLVLKLFIANTTVGDAGLVHFATCDQLEVLDASFSRVTDDVLPAFYESRALREVYLTGSRVTEKGAANLRTALPKCQVTWQQV